MNTDIGHDLIVQVTEWARQHSVPMVSGRVPRAFRGIMLTFDSDANLGFQLCERLQVLNPYLIVTQHTVLTSEDINESVEALTAAGVVGNELSAARACEKFISQVSFVDFHIFIKDGPVSLEYAYFAPWHEAAYYDAEPHYPTLPLDPEEDVRVKAEQEEREERNRAWQKEREKWTGAARTAAARRIAIDSRFPQAKTEAARVFLTREVLGSDTPSDEYLTKEISREAKAVFDFEVSPKR